MLSGNFNDRGERCRKFVVVWIQPKAAREDREGAART
jgi:hypothetical protein